MDIEYDGVTSSCFLFWFLSIWFKQRQVLLIVVLISISVMLALSSDPFFQHKTKMADYKSFCVLQCFLFNYGYTDLQPFI